MDQARGQQDLLRVVVPFERLGARLNANALAQQVVPALTLLRDAHPRLWRPYDIYRYTYALNYTERGVIWLLVKEYPQFYA